MSLVRRGDVEITKRYRPRRLSEIVGNKSTVKAMKECIDLGNKRQGAYMFYGSQGCGKTTIARIMAMGLNCEQGDTGEPCLECDDCQDALKGRATHIYELNLARLNKKEDAEDIVNGMSLSTLTGRNKVYIFDECLHYDAGITCWENGKTVRKKIGQIVHKKEKVNVLSQNKDGSIEVKPVIAWHKNRVKKINTYKFKNIRKNYTLNSTDKHIVFMEDGTEKEIGKLKKGDKVRVIKNLLNSKSRLKASKKENEVFSIDGDVRQIILGTLLGDGSILYPGKSSKLPRLCFCHSPKQKFYFDEKVRILNEIIGGNNKLCRNGGWGDVIYRCSTLCKKELIEFYDLTHPTNEKKEVNRKWLNQLNELGLAIWYMDDGSYCKNESRLKDGSVTKNIGLVSLATNGFSYSEQEIILDYFNNVWDISFKINEDKRGRGYYITTETIVDGEKFLNLVKDYIPIEFHYKLGFMVEPGNGLKDIIPLENSSNYWGVETEIAEYVGSEYKESMNKRGHVYDLEVKDNHNYFANGILVHNCQMLTTAAQNLLLKNLEEPPPNTYLFLCTTEPNKIIKPIRDRCEQHEFKLPTEAEITEVLKDVFSQEPDWNLTDDDKIKFLDNIMGSSVRGVLKSIDKVVRGGIDSMNFIQDETPEHIAICRCVLNGDWDNLNKELKKYNKNNPLDAEGLRRCVLGYLKAVLVGKGSKPGVGVSEKGASIVEAMKIFKDPYFDANSAVPLMTANLYEATITMLASGE